MEIFKYINSKDIAEHLKKIDYQFNAFESACIILDTYKIPMRERLKALKDILYFLSDCKGVDREGEEWIHINKNIKNYIDVANEFIASLFIDKGYNFSYRYLCVGRVNQDIVCGGIYESFEEAINGAKADKELQKNMDDRTVLSITRNKKGNKDESDVDEIFLTNNYEISEIIERPSITDAITYHPFYGENVHVPVPFKKGDKIWDWHAPINASNNALIYEFLEETPEGLKTINCFNEEEILENYLSMEYYKRKQGEIVYEYKNNKRN